LLVTEPRGRVLLVRTTRAGWELPGGRVEPGEGLIETGRREALEESGCTVEVGRLTGLDVDAAMLLLVYRATSDTVEPRPDPDDEDALEAGWFTVDDALQMVTHIGEHQRLSDALADRPPRRQTAG